MKHLLSILFLLFLTSAFFSQDTTKVNPGEVIINGTRHIIEDGDTIAISVLREFKYKDPNFEREWNRTVFFARRMYTYTEIIDSIVTAHDAKLDSISKLSKKKRKKARKTNKKLKKTLKSEFTYEIKNLTNIRGDYLTKMVHKKTGYSCYELIKKYKNGRTAFFWNSILWSFGSTNLKNKYDPKTDWMLKLVIDDIEAGKIKTLTRAQLIQEMKDREERDKNLKKKKKK
ncbi:MAG: DUF4294 domain-containing protein [Flavobacteriales bacterium]